MTDAKPCDRGSPTQLGHLRLTSEEMREWEKVPVLYHDELGFFIEPQWEEGGQTGLMKVSHAISAYISREALEVESIHCN